MRALDILIKNILDPITKLRFNLVLDLICPVDPAAIFPARRISRGEDLSKEVLQMRTPLAKTFQVEHNKFKVIASRYIIHYDNNGVLEEVDLRIQDIDGKKVVTKAPYTIEIFTDRVGYHLKKPDGSNYIIELVEIGGFPVNNSRLRSNIKGPQVFWEGLVPHVSMKVLLQPDKPEIFTRISRSSAPRVFTYKITQHGKFEFKSFGGDRNKDSLEILVDQRPIDSISFLYTEEWTGRVSRKDKKTRIKKWHTDPVYPVVIDPTITVPILTNDDDGFDYPHNPFTGWYSNAVTIGWLSGHSAIGGFRFQNVGVPSGATITSAQLKLHVKAGGMRPLSRIFGDKVANAVAWSNSDSPKQITKTTAYTSWVPTINAVNTIDITNQVASIVGLGSWASNNAMRFAVVPNTQLAFTTFHVFDHNTSVPNAASLVITYSVGGSGNPRHGDMNFMGI